MCGETAYVEGDCADPRSTSTGRIVFCVAYDVANGVITSARCYGAIGFLTLGLAFLRRRDCTRQSVAEVLCTSASSLVR